MRKIVICTVPMREDLTPLVYRSDEGNIKTEDFPVSFPILSCLAGMLDREDRVKVVLLCKQDPQGRYQANVRRFQEEFQTRCGHLSQAAEYAVQNVAFSDSRDAMERLLLELTRQCEEGAEILSDITYGTKSLPVVLLAALAFAVKHLGCRVEHIFYGQVYFQGGIPTGPKLCDLSYLLYLNSLIYTLRCDGPEKARQTLNKLLEL